MKWPRYCELALALWLVAASWILDYQNSTHQAMTVIPGGAILLLDILSIASPRRYSYLGVAGVALGLLAYGFLAMPVGLTGTENNVIVALLLLMFAILPTEATLPPASWRDYHGKNR